MTAKELIERLKELDPETIVHVRDGTDVISITKFELVSTTYRVALKRSMTIPNQLVIC